MKINRKDHVLTLNPYRLNMIEKTKDQLLITKLRAKDEVKNELNNKILYEKEKVRTLVKCVIKAIFDNLFSYKESLSYSGECFKITPFSLFSDVKSITFGMMYAGDGTSECYFIDAYRGFSQALYFKENQFEFFYENLINSVKALSYDSNRSLKIAKYYLNKLNKKLIEFERKINNG